MLAAKLCAFTKVTLPSSHRTVEPPGSGLARSTWPLPWLSIVKKAWSHMTGIPILALNQQSTFFFCNVHLLEDIEAAVEMPWKEIVKLQRGYDEEHGRPTLHTAAGFPLRLRALPPGTVRRAIRTGPFSHDEGYAEPRIVL